MKTTPILHTTLAILALVSAAFAQEKVVTDAEKAVKTLDDAYVAAFNKGDAKALGALYAEDTQYTNDEGTTVVGREAVIAGLTKYFTKNKDAKLVLATETARFLTPDVLVEKGFSTVGDETTRYVCSYVKKDGNWLIGELNETTLPPADEAAAALEELDWLVGTWKDNTPGISVTTTVDWTKNRHFLRRSIAFEREGEEAIEATEIIGYDPVAGGIRSWIFDSEGGFGESTWKREGNKWLVSFQTSAPNGSTSTAQNVITFLDEKKFTWESINRQCDGEVLPNLDKIEVVRASTK